jgi:hypothetical protein
MALTSSEYTALIARYLYHTYKRRGITIYREVFAGKSIIGKNRRVDLMLVCEQTSQAYAVECKYQGSQGTADEKIPYALEDLQALRMSGCLVYAGEGWSEGVLHLLRASPYAAHCLPPATLAASETTRELDHLLAMHFSWWDILTRGRQPFTDARPERLDF